MKVPETFGDVAVYDVMGTPPSPLGWNVTVTYPFPPKAESMVGGAGFVPGEMTALAADLMPFPTSLVAYTIKE